MANITSIGCTFGGKTVILPNPRDPRFRYALEMGANSFTLPVGKEAGRGFLCMEREDLDAIDFNEPQQLRWSGNIAEGGAVRLQSTFTLENIYVVNDPIRLDPSGDDNPRSLYLVEITDIRWFLNKFTSINRAYNLRKPGNNFGNGATGLTAARFFDDSLDAGAVFTWNTLAEDVWTYIEDLAGTYPALPYTPTGQPEDFRFFGANAWRSLHDVLEQVGCAPNLDPESTDVSFSMVRLGDTQAGITDLILKYAAPTTGIQLRQSDPLAAIATRVPHTIRVHFVFRDERFPDNWRLAPYTVDKATSVDGALASTVLNLWTNVASRFDYDAGQLDTATLDTVATEIKDNWLAAFNVNRRRNVFQGVVADLLPGEQVRAVQWKFVPGTGWTTIVSRRPEVHTWSETPPKTTERLHSKEMLIRFELKEALVPGGVADAYVTTYSAGWSTGTGTTVEVYDSVGDKVGLIGDVGWALYSLESGHYEIIQIFCT